MKTRSDVAIQLVQSLYEARQTIKVAQDMERDLKVRIKALMGDNAVLEAGGLVVSIDIRNRSDLDKDAIMHDLGQVFFNKYNRRTEFEVLSVKEAKRIGVG